MRRRSSSAALAVGVLFGLAAGGAALLLAPRAVRADAPGDPVVVRIGSEPSAATVGAAELTARLGAMPAFQRLTLGATPPDVTRRFLQDVVVPEKLVEIAARGARLDAQPAVAFAEDRVLSGATVRALRKRVGMPASVTDDDVHAYFEANRARYEAPERYQIWRILCRTRDEAQTVLSAAKADPSPKTFTDLARDHSQDKATNLRGGDVGFVTEDGASNEPGVRVDPAIVKAARGVPDGALVPQPVSEGDYFSVVWRRGTLAARKRTAADAAPQIRDAIAKARVKDETDRLVAQLRAAHVRDEHPELLDQLEPGNAPPAQ
jgi:peptidyl-prolyl cis-trans isomerase C